jgi:hypothetical protein
MTDSWIPLEAATRGPSDLTHMTVYHFDSVRQNPKARLTPRVCGRLISDAVQSGAYVSGQAIHLAVKVNPQRTKLAIGVGDSRDLLLGQGGLISAGKIWRLLGCPDGHTLIELDWDEEQRLWIGRLEEARAAPQTDVFGRANGRRRTASAPASRTLRRKQALHPSERSLPSSQESDP